MVELLNKKSTAKIPSTWLRRKDLVEQLGISAQAFSKWGIEPVGKRGREVFYTLRDVIDNRIENALEKGNLTTAADGEDQKDLVRKKFEEDWKLARERRIGQQQKNELMAGTMIPTDFATFALSRMAAQVASVLDTLPLSIRRAHPDLDARHIESISGEVSKARNKAAEVDEILPDLVSEYAETISEAD